MHSQTNCVIRQYKLPTTAGTLTVRLTGQWQVLSAAGRFAEPNLYIREDGQGPSCEVDFIVIGTNEPFPASVLENNSRYLGSYAVPGNMLHVFGPDHCRVAS